MKKECVGLMVVWLVFQACNVSAQSIVGKNIRDVRKNYDDCHIFLSCPSSLKRVIFVKEIETASLYTYAYADSAGNIRIQLPPFYKFVDDMDSGIDTTIVQSGSDFVNGMAQVRSASGKMGFINTSGEIAILPAYTFTGEFSEGLAFFAQVSPCSSGETRPNAVGYINMSGQQVIVLPRQLCELYACCYFRGEPFREGVATMRVSEYTHDCNCNASITIDRTGNILSLTGELLDVNNQSVKVISSPQQE